MDKRLCYRLSSLFKSVETYAVFFYAEAARPLLLTTLRSRKRTLAIPMITITVKKSANVFIASIAVVRTVSASELFTAVSISESTITPIPTTIATETIASASGTRESTPPICPLRALFRPLFEPPTGSFATSPTVPRNSSFIPIGLYTSR